MSFIYEGAIPDTLPYVLDLAIHKIKTRQATFSCIAIGQSVSSIKEFNAYEEFRVMEVLENYANYVKEVVFPALWQSFDDQDFDTFFAINFKDPRSARETALNQFKTMVVNRLYNLENQNESICDYSR